MINISSSITTELYDSIHVRLIYHSRNGMDGGDESYG